MCTAAENHCPSCCANQGGVYPLLCLVLYQLRPNQQGFVHINHTIDERNLKMVLETCGHCKRREQRRSWLKDKLASFSRIKASKHIPGEESLIPIHFESRKLTTNRRCFRVNHINVYTQSSLNLPYNNCSRSRTSIRSQLQHRAVILHPRCYDLFLRDL
jgi:hypothetical protein